MKIVAILFAVIVAGLIVMGLGYLFGEMIHG